MIKRLMSFILVVLCLTSCIPVIVYAETANFILAECFDDYAFNAVSMNSITIEAGVDGRVVEKNGYDKALYAKAWGDSVYISSPIKNLPEEFVVGADIKITGEKTAGSLFELSKTGSGTSSLLIVSADGNITLPDGKKITSYSLGDWKNYTLSVNNNRKTMDVYVDNRCVLKNWQFELSVSAPSAMSFFISAPDDINLYSELQIDNLVCYAGNEILPSSNFPYKKVNTQTENFTPKTSVDTEITTYMSVNFDTSSGYSINNKDNIIKSVEMEDYPERGKVLYMMRNNGNDCYIDMGLPTSVQSAWKFVYELDLYIVRNANRITLAEFKDSSNASYIGNAIMGYNFSINGGAAGSLPREEWVTLSLCYDMTKKKYSAYVNGEGRALNCNLPNGSFKPNLVRLTIPTGSGIVECYVDNIRLYSGTKPEGASDNEDDKETPSLPGFVSGGGKAENENTSTQTFTSVMETPEDAKKLIGNASVFSLVKDSVYFGGEKQKYTELKLVPFIENGVFMVPAELVSKALNLTIKTEGDKIKVGDKLVYTLDSTFVSGAKSEAPVAPVKKDSTVYLPLRHLAENSNRYVMYDDRGFIMVDTAEIKYKNSESTSAIKEPIDCIYRYMEYSRPKAETIYADMLIYGGGKNAHPRILTDKKNLDETKKLIETNKTYNNMFKSYIASTDKLMQSPPVKYSIPDGVRLLEAARQVLSRIQQLGVCYALTDDVKYADRCWLEMENALNWQDWNANRHYLDNSELTYAMAIGYDFLYDYLTAEQKKLVVDKTYEHSLSHAVAAYGGSYSGSEWRYASGNWGIVCPGAIVSACIAFGNEGYEEYQSIYNFLLEQAMHSLEYPLSLYYPDGGWAEGTDYWEYVVKYYGGAVLAPLHFSTGKTYDMLTPKGASDTLEYIMYMQGGCGEAFNYADAVTTPVTSSNAYIIPLITGDSASMKLWHNMVSEINTNVGFGTLLWYKETDEEATYPSLDRWYNSAWAGIMLEGWNNREGSYAAIKGGQNHTNHDNLDLGNFIFDSLGERWAMELGKDNYNIEGGYWGLEGYDLYVKRPEGQNCVVINPRGDIAGEYYGGQYLDAYAPLIRQESKTRGALMVLDLGDAYKFDTSKYIRGFYFGDERKTLTIKDEISLTSPNSEIYWFMHTKADITIDDDGKGAILTIGDKKLKVTASSNADDWHFEQRKVEPFETSPVREGQLKGYYDMSHLSKLTLVAKGSEDVDIAVKLIPMDADYLSYESVSLSKIDTWQIPDGNIPQRLRAEEIYVNGELLDGFNSEKFNYTIDLPYGTPLPTITATAALGSAQVKAATDISEAYIIEITDGQRIVTYTIKLNPTIKTEDAIISGLTGIVGIPEGMKVITGTASGITEQTENPPSNAADGNLSTRWAAQGSDIALEIDLGYVADIKGIALGVYSGASRQNIFQLLISEDGMNYYKIYDGKSTGLTGKDYEAYIFECKKARYIRYVGFESTAGTWNSVLELGAIVKK